MLSSIRPAILSIFAFNLLVANANAQKLETWTSSDGRTLKAVFYSYDSESKVVTLLVPRTIPESKLAMESVVKAKYLARNQTKEPEVDATPTATVRTESGARITIAGPAAAPEPFDGVKADAFRHPFQYLKTFERSTKMERVQELTIVLDGLAPQVDDPQNRKVLNLFYDAIRLQGAIVVLEESYVNREHFKRGYEDFKKTIGNNLQKFCREQGVQPGTELYQKLADKLARYREQDAMLQDGFFTVVYQPEKEVAARFVETGIVFKETEFVFYASVAERSRLASKYMDKVQFIGRLIGETIPQSQD